MTSTSILILGCVAINIVAGVRLFHIFKMEEKLSSISFRLFDSFGLKSTK